MKYSALLIGIVAAFASACATSQSAGPVADDALGLSKTSVFDDPSPSAFDYPNISPSAAAALPRAYDGAPPQIPHKIEGLLPITAKKNACLGCHDDPSLIGKQAKGDPTPMPESHYDKVAGKLELNNGRYVCNQCHVPQANVSELVGNTFKTAP
jgi:cytochrome c-type protein NapB